MVRVNKLDEDGESSSVAIVKLTKRSLTTELMKPKPSWTARLMELMKRKKGR